MGKLEKVPKEMKGSVIPQVEQQYELTSTPRAHDSEDGLVSHHWETRPLGLANFMCPSTWEDLGQEVVVGGQGSRARGGYSGLLVQHLKCKKENI